MTKIECADGRRRVLNEAQVLWLDQVRRDDRCMTVLTLSSGKELWIEKPVGEVLAGLGGDQPFQVFDSEQECLDHEPHPPPGP